MAARGWRTAAGQSGVREGGWAQAPRGLGGSGSGLEGLTGVLGRVGRVPSILGGVCEGGIPGMVWLNPSILGFDLCHRTFELL